MFLGFRVHVLLRRWWGVVGICNVLAPRMRRLDSGRTPLFTAVKRRDGAPAIDARPQRIPLDIRVATPATKRRSLLQCFHSKFQTFTHYQRYYLHLFSISKIYFFFLVRLTWDHTNLDLSTFIPHRHCLHLRQIGNRKQTPKYIYYSNTNTSLKVGQYLQHADIIVVTINRSRVAEVRYTHRAQHTHHY